MQVHLRMTVQIFFGSYAPHVSVPSSQPECHRTGSCARIQDTCHTWPPNCARAQARCRAATNHETSVGSAAWSCVRLLSALRALCGVCWPWCPRSSSHACVSSSAAAGRSFGSTRVADTRRSIAGALGRPPSSARANSACTAAEPAALAAESAEVAIVRERRHAVAAPACARAVRCGDFASAAALDALARATAAASAAFAMAAAFVASASAAASPSSMCRTTLPKLYTSAAAPQNQPRGVRSARRSGAMQRSVPPRSSTSPAEPSGASGRSMAHAEP
mmetsp:Transcript_14301/g.36287  ORF Transcript_14301/g.36287 Transcript_14301/m.36287 type:complete len:277 (-) Transcript_14301:320-1150(-)|eukprot:5740051-Prymnesium_polylepis.1